MSARGVLQSRHVSLCGSNDCVRAAIPSECKIGDRKGSIVPRPVYVSWNRSNIVATPIGKIWGIQAISVQADIVTGEARIQHDDDVELLMFEFEPVSDVGQREGARFSRFE